MAEEEVPQIQINSTALKEEELDESSATAFPMPDGPQRASTSTKGRSKVVLPPGHSHMDWVRLKNSGVDLRGTQGLGRYTYDDIKVHNKSDDCWIALRGKVYNITAYLDFHPGGRPKLMSVAGKDATRLFDKTHNWVNYDFLLDKSMVGFLVFD